jgi:hypothetical protein
MAPPQNKSGLFVGLNKGHIVTRRELATRPSDRKGVCHFSLNRIFGYRISGFITCDDLFIGILC